MLSARRGNAIQLNQGPGFVVLANIYLYNNILFNEILVTRSIVGRTTIWHADNSENITVMHNLLVYTGAFGLAIFATLHTTWNYGFHSFCNFCFPFSAYQIQEWLLHYLTSHVPFMMLLGCPKWKHYVDTREQ